MSVEPGVPASTATIVLLGAFNPLILSPAWLADNGIITAYDLEEIQDTRRALTAPDVSLMQFRTFALQADHERVQITSTPETETPSLIGDIVANIFTLLSHTPITGMGFNLTVHQAMEAERSRAILDRYAPQDPIHDVLGASGSVASIALAGRRDNDYAGQLRLVLEPSAIVQGIFLSLNDHYDLGAAGTAGVAANIVNDQWQESLARAETLFDKVVST